MLQKVENLLMIDHLDYENYLVPPTTPQMVELSTERNFRHAFNAAHGSLLSRWLSCLLNDNFRHAFNVAHGSLL